MGFLIIQRLFRVSSLSHLSKVSLGAVNLQASCLLLPCLPLMSSPLQNLTIHTFLFPFPLVHPINKAIKVFFSCLRNFVFFLLIPVCFFHQSNVRNFRLTYDIILYHDMFTFSDGFHHERYTPLFLLRFSRRIKHVRISKHYLIYYFKSWFLLKTSFSSS